MYSIYAAAEYESWAVCEFRSRILPVLFDPSERPRILSTVRTTKGESGLSGRIVLRRLLLDALIIMERNATGRQRASLVLPRKAQLRLAQSERKILAIIDVKNRDSNRRVG